MNINAWIALLWAWLLGGLVVTTVVPLRWECRRDRALIMSLGVLFGLGLTSTGYFLASLAFAAPAPVAAGGELALAAALWWWRRGLRVAPVPQAAPGPEPGFVWLLAAVLVQVVLVAVVVAWRTYRAEPYGGWDGWAIWNLQARFMVRAGTEWPSLLAAAPISWTHPDYPRLVPAAVARLWAWAGDEPPAAAALVSAAFALGLLGVLIAALGRSRGRLAGIAGGLLLVGTPFFVTFAANEHADIPLAAFMLAAVVLVALGFEEPAAPRWLALAGAGAGLAAWTKNEGLLFVVIFTAVMMARLWSSEGRSRVVGLLGGLAVALVPVGLFKLGLAPSNDLVAAPWGPRFAALTDLARHALIGSRLGRDLLGFGEWTLAPYLAMGLPFLAWRAVRPWRAGERVIAPILGLMLAGYYGVYLLSPHDLAWHLDSSLVRLLLQLWPLAVFAWGLALPLPPLPAPVPQTRRWVRPVIFLAANAVAFGVSLSVLSQQLAPREFARRTGAHGAVTAVLGEGWYPTERHGRDRWAWSAGPAILNLVAARDATAAPVNVRFILRGLGSRRVSVSQEGRVLWRGDVPEAGVAVEMTVVAVPPGGTALAFSSDQPGVPESGAAGARTLAFAIYNLELH